LFGGAGLWAFSDEHFARADAAMRQFEQAHREVAEPSAVG
jgi:hypothetical protein